MTVTHIVGVDPGLVHTGVVRMVFDDQQHSITVEHEAVIGPDAQAVRQFIFGTPWGKPKVFLEAYVPRSHFGTDKRMTEAMAAMKAAFSSTTIVNTGVKKIVRQPLMELLGVWRFTTVTNHQDLRSAARIALYGMLKQEPLNRLLADVVRDHLEGRTWHVVL